MIKDETGTMTPERRVLVFVSDEDTCPACKIPREIGFSPISKSCRISISKTASSASSGNVRTTVFTLLYYKMMD